MSFVVEKQQYHKQLWHKITLSEFSTWKVYEQLLTKCTVTESALRQLLSEWDDTNPECNSDDQNTCDEKTERRPVTDIDTDRVNGVRQSAERYKEQK